MHITSNFKPALAALSLSLISGFASGAAAGTCVDFTGNFAIMNGATVAETITLAQTACESIVVTYSDGTKQTLEMDGVGRIVQTAPNGRTLEFVGYALPDRSRFAGIVINPAGVLSESSIFTMSLTATTDILATTSSLSSTKTPALDSMTLVRTAAPPVPPPVPPTTPAPAPKTLQKFLSQFGR